MKTTTKNEPYTVYVCFSDPAIGEVFAALLEVEGNTVVTTKTIDELQAALRVRSPRTRAITENFYAKKLSLAELETTLVVGEEDELKSLASPTLCRPLTEQKVERAFGELLR